MKEYGLQYDQLSTLHLGTPKDKSKLEGTEKAN